MKRNTNRGTHEVTLVREVIASGSVTRLDRCGCGDLYLTVGPITMALHPEALADLSATISKAIATLGCQLARPQAEGAPAPGPATLGSEAGPADGTTSETVPRDEELN
jgi:hypothetical protein